MKKIKSLLKKKTHTASTKKELPVAIVLPEGLRWDMLPQLPLAGRRPRRLITRSGARVRGINRHPKLGNCEWESSFERNLYALLSITTSVRQAFSQPLVLKLDAGEYTPDALVFLKNGKRMWIECKPSSRLDVGTRMKLSQAALVFGAVGDSFAIVDETHLCDTNPAVLNARRFSCWFESDADFVPVVEGEESYAALTNRYGHHAVNRALARGELTFDFNTELSDATTLKSTKEGQGYEPDFIRS